MLHIDLGELAGGTLQEKFDRELTRVIENMQDPNTPFGEKRNIQINISFHQTELRDDAKVEISVSTIPRSAPVIFVMSCGSKCVPCIAL